MSESQQPYETEDRTCDASSPQLSDEKMDTGSESLASTQDTPNSIQSSDFDEKEGQPFHNDQSSNFQVLRLANPEISNIPVKEVLRLAEPINVEYNNNEKCVNGDLDKKTKTATTTIDSSVLNLKSDNSNKFNNINNLNGIDMRNNKFLNGDLNDIKPKKPNNINRPLRLGISPPRLSSTLTLTSDHPLMGLASPDSGEKSKTILQRAPEEQQKDLSLSSIEDERVTSNGEPVNFVGFYQTGPQRNTSKNNLYFTENFSTIENISNQTMSDSHRATSLSLNDQRDEGQNKIVTTNARRKIKAQFFRDSIDSKSVRSKTDLDVSNQVVLGRKVVANSTPKQALDNYVVERNRRVNEGSSLEEDGEVQEKFEVPRYLDLDMSFEGAADMSRFKEEQSNVAVVPESPSQLKSMPNFELPVEPASVMPEPPQSPPEDDHTPSSSSSGSRENEHSLFEALVDPSTGRAALRHAGSRRQMRIIAPRRRIRAVADSPISPTASFMTTTPSQLSLESAHSLDLPCDRQQFHTAEDGSDDTESEERDCQTLSGSSEAIPEYSIQEEMKEERECLKVPLPNGEQMKVDMKAIDPYKRVLSHGGYAPRTGHCAEAIIVFSACYLPDVSRPDYHYVMDNLFLYVLWTLERLITDDYILVYLHGSAAKHRLPTFHWLRKCYQLINRRLRKSLKKLYLVHPTFWLKTIMWMSKPFISKKFSRKVCYVSSLNELMQELPVEPNAIPDRVREFDSRKIRS